MPGTIGKRARLEMAARSICVFCSSSKSVDARFFAAAHDLGTEMARRGHSLVFGGTDVGLMGQVARSANAGGARVVGILPEAFTVHNVHFELADELIVTRDLRERKALMEARSEAFIAMPGGFGTLEEVLEILTLRQLQYHAKPVVFLNTGGFYDHLVEFFLRLQDDHFTIPDTHQIYHVAADPAAALDYIERYQPAGTGGPWF
jgi:cytokinin riboside 5'-monophosphate phosphoribohydrolase